MMKSTKNSLWGALLTLSLLGAGACGGTTSDPKKPAPVVVEKTDDTPPVAEQVVTSTFAPIIPSEAVSAPAGLMAELVLTDPNSQLTQVAIFMDAVAPAAGAFMSAQLVLQQLESVVGVTGLGGIDLNRPLFALALDSEQLVLVASVSDEAALKESMKNVTHANFVLHDGFVAVGTVDALTEVAPYALSNLIKQEGFAHPTFSLHLASILKGKKGEVLKREFRKQLRVGVTGNDMLLTAMSHVPMLRMSIDATQTDVTLRLVADVDGGIVQKMVAKQQPATFANMERVGTGPWGLLAGGRMDLTLLSPALVRSAERNVNPVLTQIATQIGQLSGEMAFALNFPKKPEVVIAVDLTNPKPTSELINLMMAFASKEKNLTMMDMKAKVRKGAIKTRGGQLHEIKLTPTNDRHREVFGKKPVSAYFGVAVDTLIGTFGMDAKSNAKTLVSKSGKIAGKGGHVAAALALSKSAGESFFVAADLISLLNHRESQDVVPVVAGVGFSENQVKGRIVITVETMRALANGF